MEIFGGFMVMMSIIGFFLSVVWLVMPFVVFAIKGKQDRSLEVLEAIEKRLVTLEESLKRMETVKDAASHSATSDAGVKSSDNQPIEEAVIVPESADD